MCDLTSGAKEEAEEVEDFLARLDPRLETVLQVR
jgi:hypothetical protein